MKKNLITLIILVLCFANVALTAVMVITIFPQTQKANELITKVVAAIDLDLEGGANLDTSQSADMTAIVSYPIEDDLTINLAPDADGTSHMAVISASIQMDSENEDYATYAPDGTLNDKVDMIKDKINEIVSSHTGDEVNNNQAAIKEEIKTALQEMYGSTFITGVSFGSVIVQ